MMRELINTINIHRQRQEEWCSKTLHGLEEAIITNSKNYDFQIFLEEDDDERMQDAEDEDVPACNNDSDNMYLES